MKAGQKVTIIPSIALDQLRLTDLVGREVRLLEEDLFPKHLGWWVELDEEYLNEKEWFIPISSISECKQ